MGTTKLYVRPLLIRRTLHKDDKTTTTRMTMIFLARRQFASREVVAMPRHEIDAISVSFSDNEVNEPTTKTAVKTTTTRRVGFGGRVDETTRV